ncbi:hypothetical protein ACU3L3_07180 [Priestia endophytica]
MAVEKIHKVIEAANKALELIENGKVRNSIKHLDEMKDSSIGAIHLALAELEDE